MAQLLGRTFHGCLTCRKRKVRCKGGGHPCQNCSRMNIDCHGSFDENLRISFNGSSGQSTRYRNRPNSRSRLKSARWSSSTTYDTAAQSTDIHQNHVADGGQQESDFVTIHNGSQSSVSQSVCQPAALLPQSLPANVIDGFFSQDTLCHEDYTDPSSFDVNGGAWGLDFGLGGFGDMWDLGLGSTGMTSDDMACATMPQFMSSTDHGTISREGPRENPWNDADQESSREVPLVNRDDDFYLEHYERCIGSSPYSLKDDGKGNYLRLMLDFVRSPECDANSPFRLALLAWAAKHFQVAVQADDTTWSRYYQRVVDERVALKAHNSPSTMSHPIGTSIMSSPGDVAICSTLILCRCDTLNDNMTSIRSHLDNLKSQLGEYLVGSSLSPFASQALLWLGYLHVRISLFSNLPIRDGTVSTTLLDAVTNHPDYEEICGRSHFYLSATIGGSYPQDERIQEVEKLPVSTRTHETFLLLSSMIRFRSWRNLCGDSGNTAANNELEVAKITAIELDIKRIEAEFALAAATNASASLMSLGLTKPPVAITLDSTADKNQSGLAPASNEPRTNKSSNLAVTRASLQWMSCYTVFLAAKILWSRIRYPDIRSDQTTQDTVALIFKVVLHMRQSLEIQRTSTSKCFKLPRTMAWPLPLFIAGIETTDEIHADWARRFMDEVSSWENNMMRSTGSEKNSGSGWIGISGGKRVQAVMTQTRAAEEARGRRVDIGSVMDEMSNGNGSFLI